MQQHPVPQHIASYEFRLVGDMTLKQFGLLASGCFVALIFYASNLPTYFKWPLVVFFVALGGAMAFVPVEERPLHQWLVAFFKAVYSPTQFLWEKKVQKLTFFETTPKPKMPTQTMVKIGDKKQLAQYLQTLPAEKSPLEAEEEAALTRIGNMFQMTKMPAGVPPAPTPALQPIPAPAPTTPLPTPPKKPNSTPKKPT